MPELLLTKEQARRFLLRYHHLTMDTALKNKEELLDYIRQIGCIQFDPLDRVGKNPDLVIQSRLPGYKKGEYTQLLYAQRKLFDVWDKNMSICCIEDWPYFQRNRRKMAPYLEMFKDAIDTIRVYLEKNDYASSSDFDMNEKVRWYWGEQRLARAALECMCYAGVVMVHHKKGVRRYYSLASKTLPEGYLDKADPNQNEEAYIQWQVLRRINGIGMLWNRGGDAWLGYHGFKSSHREQGFRLLLQKGKIAEVAIMGSNYCFYIDSEQMPFLTNAIKSDIEENSCRIIAPLDNLIWDRRLIQEIFAFDYKWEVYVPAAKRKYGYYVMPVLWEDRFVGRIEMRTNKSGILMCENFWWENMPRNPAMVSGVNRGVRQFAEYNLSDHVYFNLDMFEGAH